MGHDIEKVMWSRRMFSFEWHRGNDIEPTKKKMYVIRITWLLSQ